MNSRTSTFDTHLATPLYQPNADGDTAPFYQFRKTSFSLFLLITLSLLKWVHPLCNNVPGTTASNCVAKIFLLPQKNLSLSCFSFLYLWCSARSQLQSWIYFFTWCPTAFYLTDGMYCVVSRHPALRMENDSRSAGITISTLICQACIFRSICSSMRSLNQDDQVLTPDMDFCEAHPLPFVASLDVFLRPSFQTRSTCFQSISRLISRRSSSVSFE